MLDAAWIQKKTPKNNPKQKKPQVPILSSKTLRNPNVHYAIVYIEHNSQQHFVHYNKSRRDLTGFGEKKNEGGDRTQQQYCRPQFNKESKYIHTSGHTQIAVLCDPARILCTDCYQICGLQSGSSVVKSTWWYLATLENSLFSPYFLKSSVLKSIKVLFYLQTLWFKEKDKSVWRYEGNNAFIYACLVCSVTLQIIKKVSEINCRTYYPQLKLLCKADIRGTSAGTAN